jgi:beta-N-acetylhexosaminidase
VPATFSRLIVEDVLRGELGYRGVIVSDDLEMGAITEACAVGEATVLAADAGHDLLLVCHTEAAQREAAAALADAYRTRRLPRPALEAAAERVRRLRERRTARAEGGPPAPERDGAALAMAVATRAVTEVAPGAAGLRRALNGRVAAIFPRFSALAPRITIEPQVADERGYLARAFAGAGVAPRTLVVGVEPTPEEVAAAAEAAAAADATVLFLFDAHLYPSNRSLLEAVQARARALAVALLRDPYDARLLAPGVRGLTAYGFRKCQLDAVIARLVWS